MSFTRYASFDAEILDIKGSASRSHVASLDKLADFENYRTHDGYMYVRIRAISSRINKNHDGWPSVELAGSKDIFDHHHSGSGFTVEASDGNSEYGFATFVGKPIFVDHHNSNPKKARGVIVDAKLNVLDHKTAAIHDSYWGGHDVDSEHMPPTEVELLLEVDAKSFPRLAKEIVDGDLDGFSMGCFVAGTPITLDDGTQKAIEKIKVGDKVLTRTGEIEPVTATMTRQYDGDVFHVETYGQAQTMTLTTEHPVWVSRDDEHLWVEAHDIKKGDHVLTPRMQHDTDDRQDALYARLLGFYLAEGNLGYDKKRYPDGRPVCVEWNFHVDEVDYIEMVKRDLGGLGYTACGPYIKNNCATIRCNNPKLAARFLQMGGQHSWGKKLLPEILGWDVTTQRLLLDAYFNGDGHLRNDTVEIGTASKDLAHQIFAMSNRCGYRVTPPTKQHSPSASQKRPKYSMYITPSTDAHTSSAWLGFQDDAGIWRKVTKVTSEPFSGPVFNFDVQGDDSYVAADIAVHNCDVDKSKCSHCGHIATNPEEYCSHIISKGAHHDFKTADGKRVSRKSYENCYGIKFFEISAVFEPADETALAREVRASRRAGRRSDVIGPAGMGVRPDPVRPDSNQLDIEAYALQLEQQGIDPETALEFAQQKVQGTPPVQGGDGEVYEPKRWDYMRSDPHGMPRPPNGQEGFPPPQRNRIPIGPLAEDAENALNEQHPDRPRMNDPRWSSEHVAENALPQEMMTRAPDSIDTLRDEQLCPICGNDMDAETCQVCGYVQPPKEFDNPDLDKAQEIRDRMKQEEEQQATEPQAPPEAGGGAPPGGAPEGGSPGGMPANPGVMPTKGPATARVKSDMLNWTPKVSPRTAARINQIEHPVNASNPPVTNEPTNETVTKDQTKPVTASVTASMVTAQRLMATAQRNKELSMQTRTADGPTPPGDTSPKTRVDVTGVGGVDEASNDAASKADAQVDVTGIGSTGVSDVSADSTTSLPTAGRDGDNSGFDTSKTTEDSGPTKTFGDSDGSHSGVTDPVTNEPFPASEDGVKASRTAYEDGTLEGLDQQGDPIAQGGKAVQGVQPIDSVATPSYKRVNVLEHSTSPSNNSGPTTTWTGTDGNGVLKQQDPVDNHSQEWGGVKVPDVQLHTTGRVSIAAMRLAETEVELGLITREAKWNRMVEADAMSPAVVQAKLESYASVRTAGLAKLANLRQSGVTRLPKAFGKQTAAPDGFERIATGAEAQERQPLSDAALDSGLFL